MRQQFAPVESVSRTEIRRIAVRFALAYKVEFEQAEAMVWDIGEALGFCGDREGEYEDSLATRHLMAPLLKPPAAFLTQPGTFVAGSSADRKETA